MMQQAKTFPNFKFKSHSLLPGATRGDGAPGLKKQLHAKLTALGDGDPANTEKSLRKRGGREKSNK